MKKIVLATFLLALIISVPIPTMAGVDVNVSIGLPPPIVFAGPPDVVVIPDTNYVYAAPDINADLYFWNGWWWRLWGGRWYWSHYYDRGWNYYNYAPGFYFDVDPGWRRHYKNRNWYGHRWNYERIPHKQLQQNWKSWNNDRYWERKGTWGVRNYKPRSEKQTQQLRQQRQKQYQQRPEFQKQRQGQVQQPPRQQQRQPQVQQPKQQPRGKVQQQQRQPQGQQPKRSQPQGRPDKGGGEKQDRK